MVIFLTDCLTNWWLILVTMATTVVTPASQGSKESVGSGQQDHSQGSSSGTQNGDYPPFTLGKPRFDQVWLGLKILVYSTATLLLYNM